MATASTCVVDDTGQQFVSEYQLPNPPLVEDQIQRLVSSLELDPQPALSYLRSISKPVKTDDGFYLCAVPRASSITNRHFPVCDEDNGRIDVDKRGGYLQSARCVHTKLSECNMSQDSHIDVGSYDHISMSENTLEKTLLLEDSQVGDILIFLVKMTTCSVHLNEKDVLKILGENEFYLGVLEVASIALTHIRAISLRGKVGLKCEGSHWRYDNGLLSTPVYNMVNGRVSFESHKNLDSGKKVIYFTGKLIN